MTQLILHEPAAAVVNRIAGLYAAQTLGALRRLLAGKDDEALHDFRVGIRRLRSTLRAYREYLIIPRSEREALAELKAIARATNRARDSEITLIWLKTKKGALQPRDYALLMRALAQRKKCDSREVYAALKKRARAVHKLIGEFAKNSLKARTPSPFGAFFAHRCRIQLCRLRQALADIPAADYRDAAHAARIAAKRLRYVLEPLERESVEAKSATKMLRELQDLLGLINDSFVIEDALEDLVAQTGIKQAQCFFRSSLTGARHKKTLEQQACVLLGAAAHAAVLLRKERKILVSTLRRQHQRGYYSKLLMLKLSCLAMQGQGRN